jgi:hypothetical protein
MNKKNCWEFKECGREPGGSKVVELGECPAAVEGKLDGVHEGRNAGRSCWVVAGTLCKGEVQGTFAKKFEACEKCEFYEIVRGEEFPKFEFSSVLLNKLKD